MSQINIRLDDDLKSRAEALFGKLGMNMTTAITIFIRQSLLRGDLPFEVTTRPSRPKAAKERDDASFGSLQRYANPALIADETTAWMNAASEKHADS